MKIDDLSNIDYLRDDLLSKVVDKELLEKVRHSSSLSFLRGVHYGINHPVIIDYEKLKSKSY